MVKPVMNTLVFEQISSPLQLFLLRSASHQNEIKGDRYAHTLHLGKIQPGGWSWSMDYFNPGEDPLKNGNKQYPEDNKKSVLGLSHTGKRLIRDPPVNIP